jgi:predicted dehydrogenase
MLKLAAERNPLMKPGQHPKAINAGVIGYGGAFNMGRAHLQEMQKAGMTPTAVTEIDPARLAVATQDFPGIETYSSVAAMLKGSAANLITIITPHNTHARLALQCLRAGRHVVVEKPLAITTAECNAMIAAAKKNRVMLSTYHNRHWDGWIMEAVARIRAGQIGAVYRVEAHMGGWGKPGDWWRSSKSISGGILYDWGVHLLEYALQIIDSEIVEVTGFAKTGVWADQTKWKRDTNEDEGDAIVRFRNGAWLRLTISHLDSNPKRGKLEITGTKGTYLIDWPQYEIITHHGAETVVTKGKCRESEGWRFYQNVADHLVQGDPLVITAEWARRPIHILDLANRSARLGRALRAKYG